MTSRKLSYKALKTSLLLSEETWPNDVGYTTDKRPLNHEPDERKVSLKSGRLQSGIL